MEGLELLTISLSVLFGVGMIFTILLWCRSWRKEDREQTDLQIKALRVAIRKLTESVELLDHTAASLQTADGLLTRQLEDLRSSITQLQNVRPVQETSPRVEPEVRREDVAKPSEPEQAVEEAIPSESASAYDTVNDLLKQGKSTVEIARELDIGVAEVRMIARMRATEKPTTPA
jgi:hypothetical protein